MKHPSKEKPEELLEAFNERNAEAFGVVFRMMYRELYLYSAHLFTPLNMSPEDAIQDVFADIWSRTSIRFPSLNQLKSFCFIALKNTYKNKIKYLSYHEQFKSEIEVEYEFSRDVEQAELYNTLYDSLQLLSPDYAAVIRMYLEGWKPEEIARKLNIALQTVYNRRREAVIILRKHFRIP